MRCKQIEDEPKAFALIVETGDEIAGVLQQLSKSQGLGEVGLKPSARFLTRSRVGSTGKRKSTGEVVDNIAGLRVAILITDGFEQVEMLKPCEVLDRAGATTSIVSPNYQHVRSWNFADWGQVFPVDVPLDDPGNFDALLLPRGVMNPDSLGMLPKAVAFARHFSTRANRSLSSARGPGR
jgi:hypothetical protein